MSYKKKMIDRIRKSREENIPVAKTLVVIAYNRDEFRDFCLAQQKPGQQYRALAGGDVVVHDTRYSYFKENSIVHDVEKYDYVRTDLAPQRSDYDLIRLVVYRQYLAFTMDPSRERSPFPEWMKQELIAEGKIDKDGNPISSDNTGVSDGPVSALQSQNP